MSEVDSIARRAYGKILDEYHGNENGITQAQGIAIIKQACLLARQRERERLYAVINEAAVQITTDPILAQDTLVTFLLNEGVENRPAKAIEEGGQ